ncbi:unnamed protein product [Heterotrigona itama]|uniref:Uncharacterized protein n=1 Tax=Heterotrigona itama TaxID=395501 RepID=A0A6V7H061_9HYME|nr:unnamed protein product [Heterotrigona itama]
MRILLDIPRLVRMRSSECRTRKPRRMASRVWVVRVEEEGMDDRGSGTEQAVKGHWAQAGYIGDGEEGHVDGEEERMGRRVGGAMPWKIYPPLAAAMPLNRIHAILINRRRRPASSSAQLFHPTVQPESNLSNPSAGSDRRTRVPASLRKLHVLSACVAARIIADTIGSDFPGN